jgi:hypothetical protein
MQSLVVFCQRCYAWVPPQGEICPDCGSEIVLDEPDLDRKVLETIIGSHLILIGTVRIERQFLPSYGQLHGTTEGLLFLPELRQRPNGAWEGVVPTRRSGWWPFRGGSHSRGEAQRLRFPTGERIVDPAMTEDDGVPAVSLVDRLMESPGAFFAERRFIRSMTARKRTVKLERNPYRSISMVDESPDDSLCASLNSYELLAARNRTSPPQ